MEEWWCYSREGTYRFFGLHLKGRRSDYTILMIIFVSNDRFLVLLCHDRQEFIEGIFEIQMLLGQHYVK